MNDICLVVEHLSDRAIVAPNQKDPHLVVRSIEPGNRNYRRNSNQRGSEKHTGAGTEINIANCAVCLGD